jgi:hypothetical protein
MDVIRRILLNMALAIFSSTIMVSVFAQNSAQLAQPSQAQLAPGQSLGIASVPNLRDIGGYTTRDGAVVRRALAYRSDALRSISVSPQQAATASEFRILISQNRGKHNEVSRTTTR